MEAAPLPFFVDKNLSFPSEGYLKCKPHKHEMIFSRRISHIRPYNNYVDMLQQQPPEKDIQTY